MGEGGASGVLDLLCGAEGPGLAYRPPGPLEKRDPGTWPAIGRGVGGDGRWEMGEG